MKGATKEGLHVVSGYGVKINVFIMIARLKQEVHCQRGIDLMIK
jgi:hypothetical protein